MTLDELLGRLTVVRRTTSGAMAMCPAHDDHEGSLAVDTGDGGRILLHCHAGCNTDAVVTVIGITMADLFAKTISGPTVTSRPGLTLAAYAEAKRLPVDFLRTCGLSDTYVGGPCVRIPYTNEAGENVAIRFRCALDGASRFRWKQGAKPCLYGLSRLATARAAGYVVLVEGESDCHTCWHNDVPALGLPGAASWQAEWAAAFAGIETVYVVVEPDRGGLTVRKHLAGAPFQDRVRLVQFDGAKDPSALYLSDPDAFRARFQAALAAARPLLDAAAEEARACEAAAWQRCAPLARSARILPRAVAAVRALGVVGERGAIKLMVLAMVSRLLERPVSVVVKGPSSAGKSFLVEQVLRLFPPSAAYALSAMSERALAYSEEPLRHRMLVLYEAAGLRSDFASYLVRSLLSEGRLRYETVEKTKAGLRPRLIEREGPTGLIVTTTSVRLHPENETRLLSVLVTDTQAQTAAVLGALAADRSVSIDLADWHALHEWLALGDHVVTIPYAEALAAGIPPVAVRLRRDVRQVLDLIRAHALLHRATRPRDDAGRIIATLADYAVVRRLVEPLVSAGVGATVPAAVRETVDAVRALGTENVTVQQIATQLRLDKSSAWRRVQRALDDGFLRNREERKGRPARLEMGDPLPADAGILPTVRSLRLGEGGKHTPANTPATAQPGWSGGCRVADVREGLSYPSSSQGDDRAASNGQVAERFGRLDADEREAVTPLVRRHKSDILAPLDAEAVFPGARIVACLTCGSTRWRQAGDREVCVVCHPAPGSAA